MNGSTVEVDQNWFSTVSPTNQKTLCYQPIDLYVRLAYLQTKKVPHTMIMLKLNCWFYGKKLVGKCGRLDHELVIYFEISFFFSLFPFASVNDNSTFTILAAIKNSKEVDNDGPLAFKKSNKLNIRSFKLSLTMT